MKRIYRDTYIRRRIMDKAARHIKYNDGIRDIADKIKSKISEAINTFKSLPGGKKVVFLLSSLASAVSLVFAAKGVSDLSVTLKRLKATKAEFERAYKAYARVYPGTTREHYKELGVQVAILEVVITLTSSLIAMISAKIAIAQKRVQEGEDEARVVSEVMTR